MVVTDGQVPIWHQCIWQLSWWHRLVGAYPGCHNVMWRVSGHRLVSMLVADGLDICKQHYHIGQLVYIRSVGMVVADGLVPIWHQDICNHHDYVAIDVYQECHCDGCGWPVDYLAPGHLRTSWFCCHWYISGVSVRWLQMAWCLFGIRTSSTIMIILAGWYISRLPLCNARGHIPGRLVKDIHHSLVTFWLTLEAFKANSKIDGMN